MSSQRIKNTLTFANLASAASVALPHGLKTSNFRPLAPDIIFIPNALLEVTASTPESITIKNNGPDPLSGSILVEAWHTIERTFSDVNEEDLPVKPYIVVSDAGDAVPPPSIMNPMPLPEVWIISGVGGEGAETGTMNPQVSTNFPNVMTIRPGSIVGVRARTINQLQDGTISATPTINGVPAGPPAIIHGGQSDDGSIVPPGTFPYGAGDVIGMQWETSDDISPSGITMEAWIEVYEELPPL